MNRVVVAGIGTEVGKSVVSAILTTHFGGDYWKPVQSGAEEFDSDVMRTLLPSKEHRIHSPVYSFKAPLSPHHAARLEGITIDPSCIKLPDTKSPLIIEMAGGVCVPLSRQQLLVDIFQNWEAYWIVVSRHYLGSINHTLLTLEFLKSRGICPLGIIFNGVPNRDSEEVILSFSQLPLLGRLLPEEKIDLSTIRRYAKQWKISGTLLPK